MNFTERPTKNEYLDIREQLPMETLNVKLKANPSIIV